MIRLGVLMEFQGSHCGQVVNCKWLPGCQVDCLGEVWHDSWAFDLHIECMSPCLCLCLPLGCQLCFEMWNLSCGVISQSACSRTILSTVQSYSLSHVRPSLLMTSLSFPIFSEGCLICGQLLRGLTTSSSPIEEGILRVHHWSLFHQTAMMSEWTKFGLGLSSLALYFDSEGSI